MGQSPGQDQNVLGLLNDLQDKIRRLELSANSELKSGMIFDFAGSVAPTGFFICDGSAVNRVTYAKLFAAISTTYGVGDGSTTFNLPDLRGRVPVGLDNMGGSDAGRLSVANTLGGSGGEEKHQLTTAELASHGHGITASLSSTGGTRIQGQGNDLGNAANGTGSAGSDTPHNNMQPYLLMNKIIVI